MPPIEVLLSLQRILEHYSQLIESLNSDVPIINGHAMAELELVQQWVEDQINAQ